jgi:CubicO group peptidase (beta-lactamase class C family)
VRVWILLLVVLPAWGAPDEALLRKNDNYPTCRLGGGLGQGCLVGSFSRYDELVPARKVAAAGKARELKRAPKPKELGVDAYLADNRNTGLLILKGDTIVAERYQYDRGPQHRFTSMSMAKTVVAMLAGIALHEQKIKSIDDKAEQYVPELKGQPFGETSLRHLLTMSSGVSVGTRADGGDDSGPLYRKTILQQGPGGADTVLGYMARGNPAGTRFFYSSNETQVLGLVLRAATGRTLADYCAEKLWQPMGAEADATWVIDRGGYETGYAGLNATLRDWGRLGLLLAHTGERDGRQIIPADWVRAATKPDAPHLAVGVATRNSGYGYQTWLIDREGRFALLGAYGQAVMVDPKAKVVMVHTAVHSTNRDAAARALQFRYFYSALKTLASD